MLNVPRYNALKTMGQHKDELDAAIEAWLDTLPSVDEAVALLQKHRVPCAPILSIPEVIALPHSKERGLMRTIPDALFGDIHVPRTPLRFSEFPETPDLRAGTLGQYNHEILRERLGYTEAQIAHLATPNIIASKNI